MANASVAAPRRRFPIRVARPAPPTVALVLLLIAAATVLLYVGRHLTFYADEWVWLQYRRGGGLSAYLQASNDHFSLFPMAVYRLLFAVVGMRHYTAYRAADVGLSLVCAVFLYILARRRLGPWLALVPTTLLLFMGTGAQDLLWGFQIGFLGSVAGGLGALILIEDRRSDVLATVLLVWAIISSGVGLAFLVACFVMLLARRDPWSRLWIVAVPGLVFLVWYLGYGHSDQITLNAILGAPGYIGAAAAGVATGIAGLGTEFGSAPVNPWGPAIIVAALVAFYLSWRARVGGQPTPLLLAAAAGALTFWGLTALQRAGPSQPSVSRYLYIGAVFVWLIAAEVRLGSTLRGMWLVLAGLLAAGALIGNLEFLRTTEIGLRELSDNVRASLTATDIAAPVVSPRFIPYPVRAPEIVAGPYLAAAHALGSPGFTVAELAHAPFAITERADRTLVRAERVAAVPVAGMVGCQLAPQPPGGSLPSPGSEVLVHNASSAIDKVYLRRFVPGFGPPRFTLLPAHATKAISFPGDLAPRLPWHVIVVPAPTATACIR